MKIFDVSMKFAVSITLLVAALAISCLAYAGLASFSIRIQDDLRVADVDVVDMGGESYVSLSSLVNQMGGGCRVTPERVQVDLAAKAAWLNLDVTQVSSSLGVFNLAHPMHGKDGEALIALIDVVPLFQKAFNLAIKQDLPVQAAPSIAEPSSAPATPEVTSEPLPKEPPATTSEPPPPVPPQKGGEPPARVVKRTIQVLILDPGHGGLDAGCEAEGGLKESQLALNIAVKVRNALEGSPVKVLLTRDKDNETARAERAAFANKNKGDLYIAIHLGAGLSKTGHGIEAFCYDPEQSDTPQASAETKAVERPGKDYAEQSMAAAKVLIDSVAAAAGQDVRGIHQVPCAILNDIDMPGFILETGYINNPAEESLLLTGEYQDKIANGLAEGIKKLATQPGGVKP